MLTLKGLFSNPDIFNKMYRIFELQSRISYISAWTQHYMPVPRKPRQANQAVIVILILCYLDAIPIVITVSVTIGITIRIAITVTMRITITIEIRIRISVGITVRIIIGGRITGIICVRIITVVARRLASCQRGASGEEGNVLRAHEHTFQKTSLPLPPRF
jgi:hypothetical protein